MAKARANAEQIRKICMGPFPGLAPSGEPDAEVNGSEDDLVFEEGDRSSI